MSTTWCLTFFLVICLYHRAQGVSITKKGCDDESIPSASHIKFTSSSTCRCQRNFSWGRKWNLRAVAVTIRYPHNHTTQACRSDLNHLLDMTPIFSMHHVSRSIFFSTPHKHPTRSCTNQNASQHVIAQQGLSEPFSSGLGCAPGTSGISYSCVFRLFERTYSIIF